MPFPIKSDITFSERQIFLNVKGAKTSMFSWLHSLFTGKTHSHSVFHAGCKPAKFDEDWTTDEIVKRVEFWTLMNEFIKSPLNRPFLNLHHFSLKTHEYKKPLTPQELFQISQDIILAHQFIKIDLPQRLAHRRKVLQDMNYSPSERGPDKEFESIRRLLILTPILLKRYVLEINQNSGSTISV